MNQMRAQLHAMIQFEAAMVGQDAFAENATHERSHMIKSFLTEVDKTSRVTRQRDEVQCQLTQVRA